jgi:hypothetical protein
MFKTFKNEWPYYFLMFVIFYVVFYYDVVFNYVVFNSISTSPLTNDQLQEIKTKITAYNLDFVSTKNKEFFGCGDGHLYRVPVITKNKQGQEVIVNYCSGNSYFIDVPSRIKIPDEHIIQLRRERAEIEMEMEKWRIEQGWMYGSDIKLEKVEKHPVK